MSTQASTSTRNWRDAAVTAGVLVCYTVAAGLAYVFPGNQGFAWPLWPASGVLLAALLLLPTRFWRGLLGSVFLLTFVGGWLELPVSLLGSLGMAVATVAESFACAWLIQRVRTDNALFERVREVAALTVGAVFINAVTAALGAASVAAQDPAPFGELWRAWCIANGVGILLITPVLAGWVQWRRGATCSSTWPKSEAALFLVVWVGLCWIGFHPVGGITLRPYMALVLLAWPALRLPTAVAPTAVFLLDAFAILEFQVHPTHLWLADLRSATGVLWIQLFAACAAITALVMSSMRAETRAALAMTRREAESARSAHARAQALLDSSLDGIHVLDRQGRLVLWGESFLRSLGYTADEAATLRVFDWDAGLPPEQLTAMIAQLIDKPQLFMTRHRRKDGTEFDVEINARGVGLDGEMLLFASARDVSERRRAEDLLRASEQRFHTVANAAPVMMWQIGADGRRMFANDRWFAFAGEARRQAPPTDWASVVHPDDRERVLTAVREAMHQAAAPTSPLAATFRARRHDGEYRWLFVQGVILRDTPDAAPVLVASAMDITEARAAEERLRTSERDLRAAERLAHIGHWYWDVQSGETRFSDGLAAIFGFSREEVGADFRRRVQGMVHPDDQAEADERWRRMKAGTQSDPFEFRFVRADGDVRVLRTVTGHVGRDDHDQILALSGVIMDLTDRRRVEDALRESDARWQFAVDGSGDGIWDWDVRTGEVFFSDRWKTMLGYEPHEIGASLQDWSSRVHPDDLPLALEAVQAHLRGETPRYECEHRVRCKDGSWKWIQDRGVVVRRGADGSALRVIGTHRDITARRESEAALIESEARFRAVADSAPVLIWVTDAHGRPIKYNQHWSDFTGLLPTETWKDEWVAAMHPEDYVRCKPLVEADTAKRVPYEVEYRMRRRDGLYRWIFERARPRFAPSGEFLGYVGAGLDITEQVELRSALTEARESSDTANRVKSEFLANMSHEIRTPLNGVLGHVQLLSATPLTEEQRANVLAIQQSATNLLSIVNDVLDLSKIEAGRVVLNPAEFDVAACLNSVVGLQRPRASAKGLTLQLEILPEVPASLVGDELRVRQILQNLVSNAVKFTLAGSVTVTASATMRPDGATVLGIAVADTGVGIAPSALEHIFDPFVQADSSITRRFGGTGLGLAIVRRLAAQMDGTVEVRSVEGAGSIFQVLLPLRLPARHRPRLTTPERA